jgi:hypothetical protein
MTTLSDMPTPADYDQRRQGRARNGNLDGLLVADIGAYEASADELFASLGA